MGQDTGQPTDNRQDVPLGEDVPRLANRLHAWLAETQPEPSPVTVARAMTLVLANLLANGVAERHRAAMLKEIVFNLERVIGEMVRLGPDRPPLAQ